MIRNLDTTQLRSFVHACEIASITGAANRLNLTQAAVSQHIRKLESQLETVLFIRENRSIRLTPAAERLLPKAQKLLSINDDIWQSHHIPIQERICLGIPPDLVRYYMPRILKDVRDSWPSLNLEVSIACSVQLKEQLAAQELDVILTTDFESSSDAMTLTQMPLVWFGAQKGQAYLKRPLNLALSEYCSFRPAALQALADNDVEWSMKNIILGFEYVETLLTTDLIVLPGLARVVPHGATVLPESCGLPILPEVYIKLMQQSKSRKNNPLLEQLAQCIQGHFVD